MGNWESIANEVIATGGLNALDVVRRRKIADVVAITNRSLIIYAVDSPVSNPIKGQIGDISISLTDKDGFDEVTRNLPGPNLDVVLHTPGGSAEATESVVELLRARFDDIRFIVPNMAKSAGTIMAMAGNQILMDERSELGPTDPQMLFYSGQQARPSPAQAIKDQFEQAQQDINGDPARLPGWVPILQAYGPSLLAECDNHIELAKELVRTWLEKYMFAGDADGSTKSRIIADYLADHKNFLSHGRRLGMGKLIDLGVNILNMNTQPALRDAVWDLYLATSITFLNSGAYKSFENSNNEALIRQIQMQFKGNVNQPQSLPTPPQTPINPLASRPPRSERKRGK